MTTVLSYPKMTIGNYDVIIFPELDGQVYAIVYPAGSRKAVWETLRFEIPQEAQSAAKAWIEQQQTQEEDL